MPSVRRIFCSPPRLIALLAVPLALIVACAAAAPATAKDSAQPPKIKHESVTDISSTDVLLHAQIDPDGLETTYYFQVGEPGTYSLLMTCPSAEPCEALWWGDHLPPQTLAPAFGYSTTSADVAKEGGLLQLDTIYHYRVVASNADGTTYGHDRTFKTKR